MSETRTAKPASLTRRALRVLIALAIMFVVAWTAGTLLLASQVPSETRNLIGAAAAIVFAVIVARSGGRR